MSQQDSFRNIVQRLAALEESPSISSNVPEVEDSLVEELAAEYRAFLSELVTATTSSQAKPATAPMAGNITANTGNTTVSTTASPTTTSTQDQSAAAQQELEKTISQLKPSLGATGASIDPKKTAQALQAAATGQQAPADAAKAFAPALGKALSNPEIAKKLGDLFKNIK